MKDLLKVREIKLGSPVMYNKDQTSKLTWGMNGCRLFFDPAAGIVYVQDTIRQSTTGFGTPNIVNMFFFDEDIKFLPEYSKELKMPGIVDRSTPKQSARVIIKEEYREVEPMHAKSGKLGSQAPHAAVPARKRTVKELDK